MTTMEITLKLDIDNKTMFGNDKNGMNWFIESVLKKGLYLHSDEIGDDIGAVVPLSCTFEQYTVNLTEDEDNEINRIYNWSNRQYSNIFYKVYIFTNHSIV